MPDQNTLHATHLSCNIYCGWNSNPSSKHNCHGPHEKPQSYQHINQGIGRISQREYGPRGLLQAPFSCSREMQLYCFCYCCLPSPCFTHGREPSLLPLSHTSSQATTCNKKLTPKIRIITVYWNTPLKCLHPQHHMDPAKDLRERGGERDESF